RTGNSPRCSIGRSSSSSGNTETSPPLRTQRTLRFFMKTVIRTVACFVAFALATSARAADIKVFCTNGVKAVVEELLPQFERTTGNKGVISYEPSTQIKKRIDAGEPFDLAMMTTALIDAEIKAGKLQFESRRFVARSGLGLSIRSGAK